MKSIYYCVCVWHKSSQVQIILRQHYQ
ncbi:DUF3927 domain-containing protein [Photobacterium damselae subsp. damselae]|nr:DUF3927 domain-containing protein [Photobacterium damselae subsp. damselae]